MCHSAEHMIWQMPPEAYYLFPSRSVTTDTTLHQNSTFFRCIERSSWRLHVGTRIPALLFIVKCQPVRFDPNGKDIFGRNNTCSPLLNNHRTADGAHAEKLKDFNQQHFKNILTFDGLFMFPLLTFKDLFQRRAFSKKASRHVAFIAMLMKPRGAFVVEGSGNLMEIPVSTRKPGRFNRVCA